MRKILRIPQILKNLRAFKVLNFKVFQVLQGLILVVALAAHPLSVFASGGVTVSPNTITVEVGGTQTFTITATNVIGDVSISSSDSTIASVSAGEWGTGMVEAGQTKTGNITVTGVREGNATITLTIDAATFDSEDLSDQTRTIAVTIVAPSAPPQSPAPQPVSNNPSSSQPTSNNPIAPTAHDNSATPDNSTPAQSSTNNGLKEISVEGHKLQKIDDTHYTLSVSHNVTEIAINATPEDDQATILGIGTHSLEVGNNDIELIVISESGDENRINLSVTRKSETPPTVSHTNSDDSTDSSDTNKSSSSLFIILAIVVILAVTGVAAFFYIRKKRSC